MGVEGGIVSRDARASGLKRARRCHVCLSSDRTACAVPLVLIAYGDTQFGWRAQGLCDGRGVALLAEMREHPGWSAQDVAMFASVQTGRLAPFRSYSAARSEPL